MSKRSFRLAAVLRIRRAQEQQAAGALARAGALLEQADEQAAGARAAHATHNLSSGEGKAFLASVAARAALNVAAQDAEVERELAQRGVDSATDEWRAARRTTRSLEHLQTKHDEAARRADARREQKTLDDFRTGAPGSPVSGQGDQ